MIFECLETSEARARLKDKIGSGTFNYKALFYTRKGIEELLVFLQETGIATRKWYLEREERGEDESSVSSRESEGSSEASYDAA